jgi:spore germination cell wall hydrolase CwlJ-like protein
MRRTHRIIERLRSLRPVRLRRRHVRLALYGGIPALVLLFLSAAEGGLQREIECLARNIYFEARTEPEEGRRAITHVVLNRVADPRWPDAPCAVIAQGYPQDGRLCQFSWYCDDNSNRPRRDAYWRDAKRLARRVYWGRSQDPTGGALWYHADYVKPQWRRTLHKGPQIGRHIFYRDKARAGRPGA